MSQIPPVRAANADIAAQYDAIPYEAPLLPLLDVSRLRGVTALYGRAGPVADVLDLGCGTGAQLARAAEEVSGALVGVDISAASCERATARLSACDERARILCGDLLDQGETLGEFDLIYVLGVIFAAPVEVRRSIIDLVGRRLRPGGIAAISYYAGSIPAIRGNLNAMLRASLPAEAPLVEAIRMARETLRLIEAGMGDLTNSEPIRLAIAQTAALPDDQFLYQVLSPTFDAIRTSELERDLAAHGLVFATYLPLQGVGAEPTSTARALAADALDFRFGGYHCAVFFKPDGPVHALDVTTDHVAWESPFKRANPGHFTGPAQFAQTGAGRVGTVKTAISQAILDALATGPASWSQARDKAGKALNRAEVVPEPDSVAITDLEQLWAHGMINALGR